MKLLKCRRSQVTSFEFFSWKGNHELILWKHDILCEALFCVSSEQQSKTQEKIMATHNALHCYTLKLLSLHVFVLGSMVVVRGNFVPFFILHLI